MDSINDNISGKTRFVDELKPGDSINDIFALTDKTLGKKKDGNNYLTMTLSDRSGRIKAVLWEDADTTTTVLRNGGLVHARGSVSEYQGQLQIVLAQVRPIPDSDVDPEAFLPKTQRNIEVMFARLARTTESMGDADLKSLLESFFNDDSLMTLFKKAPAAKIMHHAYIGGLLEHTLSMVLLADSVAGHYSGIDRDLLLAGVVLHDIGKIEEFVFHHVIDYSDAGRLLGHIIIGVRMIDEKLERLKGFPAEKAILLKHLVLSHHGTREYGSPEVPKTIEAVLLHYIDEIDSKINGVREFIESDASDESWTSYHKILGRQFFRKKAD